MHTLCGVQDGRVLQERTSDGGGACADPVAGCSGDARTLSGVWGGAHCGRDASGAAAHVGARRQRSAGPWRRRRPPPLQGALLLRTLFALFTRGANSQRAGRQVIYVGPWTQNDWRQRCCFHGSAVVCSALKRIHCTMWTGC
jgi:hypothetical protein